MPSQCGGQHYRQRKNLPRRFPDQTRLRDERGGTITEYFGVVGVDQPGNARVDLVETILASEGVYVVYNP